MTKKNKFGEKCEAVVVMLAMVGCCGEYRDQRAAFYIIFIIGFYLVICITCNTMTLNMKEREATLHVPGLTLPSVQTSKYIIVYKVGM